MESRFDKEFIILSGNLIRLRGCFLSAEFWMMKVHRSPFAFLYCANIEVIENLLGRNQYGFYYSASIVQCLTWKALHDVKFRLWIASAIICLHRYYVTVDSCCRESIFHAFVLSFFSAHCLLQPSHQLQPIEIHKSIRHHHQVESIRQTTGTRN